MKTQKEWEDELLATPLAGRVSGEHDEHQDGDLDFQPNGMGKCRCKRCLIIRIKKRRAFKFPRRKCPNCGVLYFGILTVCASCHEKGG